MRVLVLVVSLFLSAHPLWAQEISEVSAGERARITLQAQPPEIEGYAPPQVVRGTLTSVGPDSVSIGVHPNAAPVTIFWPAVETLELSGGVRSRTGSAIRRGSQWALLGALEGVVLNALDDDPDYGTWEAVGLGAAAGAIVGIVWGAFRPDEIWREVD